MLKLGLWIFGFVGVWTLPVAAQLAPSPTETQLRVNATLQDALIWTGHYEGLSDGTIGERSISAMAAFQQNLGIPPTGDLAADQKLRLLQAADDQRRKAGFRVVQDPHVGVNVGLPAGLVFWRNTTQNGSRYASADGLFEIIVSRFQPDMRPLRKLFDAVTASTQMKQVTLRVYRRDAFFVGGANATQDFYYTAKVEGGVIRGLAITTQRARRSELSRVIVATANAFHNSVLDYAPVAALISRPQSAVAGYERRADPQQEKDKAAAHQIPTPPNANPPGDSAGSGFFVDRVGHILTNDHVVAECTSIVTKGYGEAKLVRRDPSNDLALLKVPPNFLIEPARFREDELDLGERVVAVGYPMFGELGTSLNITTGLVSSVIGPRGDGRYIQISAAVQNGNSGGPTLEQSGRVAGVVTKKFDHLRSLVSRGAIPENVAFALRSNYALAFLRGSRITPVIDTGSTPRSEKDIAKEADRFTVLIGCLN